METPLDNIEKKPSKEAEVKKDSKPCPLTLDMLNFQSMANVKYRNIISTFVDALTLEEGLLLAGLDSATYDNLNSKYGLELRTNHIVVNYGKEGLSLFNLGKRFDIHPMLLMARYELRGGDMKCLLGDFKISTWCYHGQHYCKEDLEKAVGMKFDDFMCEEPKLAKARALKSIISRPGQAAYGAGFD